MMLRAIIIDDEQKGINLLRMIIDEFIKDVKVVAFSTSARDAIELIENYKPEVVFLDINMPEMNGFELLEKLTWKNFNLVFVTAYQEYAIRALKNNAMDYLLKPVDHRDLAAAIEKIKLNASSNDAVASLKKYSELLSDWQSPSTKNKIFLNLRSGVEAVLFSNIICFESQSNYTLVYLEAAQPLLVSRNLKSFEEELDGVSTFMRVHNSYIVNTQKIAQYLKTEEHIVMVNKQQVPLSKSRKKLFYDWMNV